jgi:hypothetical protein
MLSNQFIKAADNFAIKCQGSPDLAARNIANDYLKRKNYAKYQHYWEIYQYLVEKEAAQDSAGIDMHDYFDSDGGL